MVSDLASGRAIWLSSALALDGRGTHDSEPGTPALMWSALESRHEPRGELRGSKLHEPLER